TARPPPTAISAARPSVGATSTRTSIGRSTCSPGSTRTAWRSCGSRCSAPSTTPRRKSTHDHDGSPRRLRRKRPEPGCRRPPPHRPDVTMDDGADLVGALHMIALNRLDDLAPPVRRWVETLSGAERKALVTGVVGSTEETTTGVIRLKAMARDGVLQFPVIAV